MSRSHGRILLLGRSFNDHPFFLWGSKQRRGRKQVYKKEKPGKSKGRRGNGGEQWERGRGKPKQFAKKITRGPLHIEEETNCRETPQAGRPGTILWREFRKMQIRTKKGHHFRKIIWCISDLAAHPNSSGKRRGANFRRKSAFSAGASRPNSLETRQGSNFEKIEGAISQRSGRASPAR